MKTRSRRLSRAIVTRWSTQIYMYSGVYKCTSAESVNVIIENISRETHTIVTIPCDINPDYLVCPQLYASNVCIPFSQTITRDNDRAAILGVPPRISKQRHYINIIFCHYIAHTMTQRKFELFYVQIAICCVFSSFCVFEAPALGFKFDVCSREQTSIRRSREVRENFFFFFTRF